MKLFPVSILNVQVQHKFCECLVCFWTFLLLFVLLGFFFPCSLCSDAFDFVFLQVAF